MMNPLAEMWARKELKRLQRKELRLIVQDLREAQRKLEPLRQLARDRYKAGVRGDGFVMKPTNI